MVQIVMEGIDGICLSEMSPCMLSGKMTKFAACDDDASIRISAPVGLYVLRHVLEFETLSKYERVTWVHSLSMLEKTHGLFVATMLEKQSVFNLILCTMKHGPTGRSRSKRRKK